MANNLTIIFDNYKKASLPYAPQDSLNAVLANAKQAVGISKESQWCLVYNKNILDLSLPLRYANIPRGAKLEAKSLGSASTSSTAPTTVTVALSITDQQQRIKTVVPCTENIWNILRRCECELSGSDVSLSSLGGDDEQTIDAKITACSARPLTCRVEKPKKKLFGPKINGDVMYYVPTVQVLTNLVRGQDLCTTSLKKLGITSGSVAMKLSLALENDSNGNARSLRDVISEVLTFDVLAQSESGTSLTPSNVLEQKRVDANVRASSQSNILESVAPASPAQPMTNAAPVTSEPKTTQVLGDNNEQQPSTDVQLYVIDSYENADVSSEFYELRAKDLEHSMEQRDHKDEGMLMTKDMRVKKQRTVMPDVMKARVLFPDGVIVSIIKGPNDLISALYHDLDSLIIPDYIGSYKISTTVPRIVYERDDTTSFASANLLPTCVFRVVCPSSKSIIKRDILNDKLVHVKMTIQSNSPSLPNANANENQPAINTAPAASTSPAPAPVERHVVHQEIEKKPEEQSKMPKWYKKTK